MGSSERFYVDIQSLNDAVTGSCHMCIVKYPDGTTNRFIVDCGLFQGRNENDEYNKSFPFNEDNIDFALITHNHVDHVGRLPLLWKQGYRNHVYTSLPTSKLISLALYDSNKVLKDIAKRNHVKELYSEDDVQCILSKVKGIDFDCSFLPLDNNDHSIKVTFFKNGHLVGATIILVQISYPGCNPINILFTGDYNSKNMFFEVPKLPAWVLDLPIFIVQESTYGKMNSCDIQPCFEDNILSAVSRKKTVVIPVFSLGRSQEILYFLKNLQDEGKLDTSIPIYFDGKLAWRYTNLYLNDQLGISKDMLDFLPQSLEHVDNDMRDEILSNMESKLIVTTSGMGSYGPAQVYIPAFIKYPNALIHFTGYTAEGTLGSRLKNTPIGEVVKVGGLLTKKFAEVEYTSEFSAHAKADEMIDFLKQFKNINLIIVNHGEPDVKEAFARRILDEVSVKDVGIASRDTFFRITPYRLHKTLNTKFQ